MKPKRSKPTFGWLGIELRWTHGDKDGVGTAYAASSRIWFTLWNGVITEVYYPTKDHTQIRDLQYANIYWHRPDASPKAKTPISRLGLTRDDLSRIHRERARTDE